MRRCPRPSRAGRGHQIAGQSDADPPDDPLVLAALAVVGDALEDAGGSAEVRPLSAAPRYADPASAESLGAGVADSGEAFSLAESPAEDCPVSEMPASGVSVAAVPGMVAVFDVALSDSALLESVRSRSASFDAGSSDVDVVDGEFDGTADSGTEVDSDVIVESEVTAESDAAEAESAASCDFSPDVATTGELATADESTVYEDVDELWGARAWAILPWMYCSAPSVPGRKILISPSSNVMFSFGPSRPPLTTG